jgi:hypothetical protein
MYNGEPAHEPAGTRGGGNLANRRVHGEGLNRRLSMRPESETKYYYVDRPAISIFLGLLTAAPDPARSAASRIVLTSESGMDLRPDHVDRTPHLAIVRICFPDPRTSAGERFPCQRREAKCRRPSGDVTPATLVAARCGGKLNRVRAVVCCEAKRKISVVVRIHGFANCGAADRRFCIVI